MPPRKSLPALREANRSTPRRGDSSTPAKRSKQAEATPRKRQRLHRMETEDDLESIEAEPPMETRQATSTVKVEGEKKVDGNRVMDPEKELEHWQDFAVEHYEMVEQLPLELHRNYRLLRELDDGNAVHAEKLQNAIRGYIAYRLGFPTSSARHDSAPAPVPPLPSLTLDGGAGPVTADGDQLESVLEIGIPQSDGEGGQVMPPPEVEVNVEEDLVAAKASGPATSINGGEDAGTGTMDVDAEEDIGEVEEAIQPADEGRRAFPAVSPSKPEADVLPPQAIRHDSQTSMAGSKNKGSALLPEIARLAREMVKNGEEKVAVAIGAYNSIDRHIRALDSALSAQEASILLGLRPSTLPSTAVEAGLENGDTGAKAEVIEGVIGTGGGGARRKGRATRGRGRGRGRGGGKAAQEAVLPTEPVIPAPVFADADPSEPRYCYCHQVSYGEMIGCDNDDCPIEWFHLACVGLTAPPAGKWLCNVCSPVAEKGKAGKAGSATVVRGTGRGSRGRGRGR